jgi:hypothetical protein
MSNWGFTRIDSFSSLLADCKVVNGCYTCFLLRFLLFDLDCLLMVQRVSHICRSVLSKLQIGPIFCGKYHV